MAVNTQTLRLDWTGQTLIESIDSVEVGDPIALGSANLAVDLSALANVVIAATGNDQLTNSDTIGFGIDGSLAALPSEELLINGSEALGIQLKSTQGGGAFEAAIGAAFQLGVASGNPGATLEQNEIITVALFRNGVLVFSGTLKNTSVTPLESVLLSQFMDSNGQFYSGQAFDEIRLGVLDSAENAGLSTPQEQFTEIAIRDISLDVIPANNAPIQAPYLSANPLRPGFDLSVAVDGTLSVVDTDPTNGDLGTQSFINPSSITFNDIGTYYASLGANDGTRQNISVDPSFLSEVLIVVGDGNGLDFNIVNGGAAGDLLIGANGADRIKGLAGNDILVGGTGDDTLDGGGDKDTLFGGAGNDTLKGRTGADVLQGDSGNDSLVGGNGHDTLQGGAGDDTLKGGGRDDLLEGGDGNDRLDGGGRYDTLQGGAGNDTLSGNSGTDSLVGGSGNDELSGNQGSDTLEGGIGDDTLSGNENNDSLKGGDGLDSLRGDTGNDTLEGEAGADTLLGGDGNDTLDGGAGNDSLTGGTGDDTLDGGSGTDILEGGDGNDSLQGSAGADTFVYAATGSLGNDIIESFEVGLDTITFGGQSLATFTSSNAVSETEVVLTLSNLLTVTLSASSTTGDAQIAFEDRGTANLVGTPFGSFLDSLGVNVGPTATNDAVTISEDGPATAISVTANDVDPNVGDNLIVSSVDTSGLSGLVSITPDGKGVVYNPNGAFENLAAGASVIETFTYTVSDGAGGTSTATVTVTIQGADETPTTELSDIATGIGGFVINGVSAGDLSGSAVSLVGDVNGDGLDDLFIGARGDAPNGFSSGAGFVVFGKSDGTAVELSDIEADTGGFVVDGLSNVDYAGGSVSSAGDVNGDGLADILIGASGSDIYANDAGAAFVIFGKTDTSPVQLANFSVLGGGFQIRGTRSYDYVGIAISGGGDINGDGLDDLIVGISSDGLNGSFSGRTFVVYGKTDGTTVRLPNLDNGNDGFAIDGVSQNDSSGRPVSIAGDVNGDGLDDLLVAAIFDDPNGPESGASFVVFGKSDQGTIDLSAVENGVGGFVVNGVSQQDLAGFSLSDAGDVNGDGHADLIVGAAYDDPNGTESGASFVVFGKSDGTAVELSDIEAGTGGFVINGVSANDYSATSVSSAGDINGDGLDDLIVGALRDDPNGTDSGAAFVVYGKTDGTAVELSAIEGGTRGFVLNGASSLDYAGRAVSGGGDINGDGFADVIVGAFGDSTNGSFSGASFVVFGGDFTGAATEVGTGGDDTLTGTSAVDGLFGGAGNDTLIGSGGADVLRGGAGNDVMAISDLTAAVVDGGNGIDTLRLDASALRLALASTAGTALQSIEAIDLAGGGNTLVAGRLDVLQLSEGSNTLRITGTSADTVELVRNGSEVWSSPGTITGSTGTYTVFSSGRARLEVQQGIQIAGDLFVDTDLESIAQDGNAAGFVINGVSAGDLSGGSVSNAGDINGDGLDDLIVGALLDDPNAADSGASFVVFGKADGTSVELSDIEAGIGGFVINGASEGDNAGASVSAAGDVNGDGFADVIIGAPEFAPRSFTFASSYVVFGKSDGAPVELSAVEAGVGGFVLNAAAPDDITGATVSNAGDVNGDGLDDLLVGAPYSNFYGYGAGASFVVFGKTDGTEVNLGVGGVLSGVGGFTIRPQTTSQSLGRDLSTAGDVNGDGLDDILIGDPSNNSSGTNAGASFVVFGKTDTSAVDLSSLDAGNGGFSIIGAQAGSRAGESVSNVGDVNGDGLDDVIIGASADNPNGPSSGASYVVFGKSDGSTVALSDIQAGSGGFAINGASSNDFSGTTISAAGDINGDGFGDFIIGTYPSGGSTRDTQYKGTTFVVFGKSDGSTIELSDVDNGIGGFVVTGNSADDQAGDALSVAGDVNGDGFDDLIIGAALDDPNGVNSGASFVVFGGDFTGSATTIGTVGDDTLTGTVAADILIGGTGNDILIGAGGADVLRAGAGDDVIGVGDLTFQVIDGGNGVDTLRLDGAGERLDLTAALSTRLESIEQIDLAGGGNTLVTGRLEVLRLSEATNTLRIAGTAADTVEIVGAAGTAWIQSGTVVDSTITYDVFVNGLARLEIQQGITLAGDTVPTLDLSQIEDSGNGAGFVINGAAADDASGFSVSGGGDINGDGFEDVIVGAYRASPNDALSGASFVVFGKADGAVVELSDVASGTGGFAINGVSADDRAGRSVSTIGDVNGDGLTDVLIGALNDSPNGVYSGASFVVFGKSDGTAVELSDVEAGVGGFVINGVSALDEAGRAVSNAGDVNGDGLDDLIVGAQGDDPSGASFLVFGKSDGTAVELSDVEAGVGGFAITSTGTGGVSGNAISAAGDVNNDGLADLIVGVGGANLESNDAGVTFVVHGKTDTAPVELSAVGNGVSGFAIRGINIGDYSGGSISGGGDINGDGIADIVIGAPGDDPSGSESGAVFVVFGKTDQSAVELSDVEAGVGGFVINGTTVEERVGNVVSVAGDINGDGLADLIIGTYPTDPTTTLVTTSYVVFGKSDGAAVELSDLEAGTGGFVFNSVSGGDQLGRSLSAAGDVDGDGFDDIIVGAPGDDPNGDGSGASFVVFGGDFSGAATAVGTAGNDILAGTSAADVLIGGAGNDAFTGFGGADVLRGGAGNDFISIDDVTFKVIDGGTGNDTLQPSGGTLDLTTLGDTRIESIETIDLAGVGTSLILDRQQLLRLSDETNTLRVEGNGLNTVQLAGSDGAVWVKSGDLSDAGKTFDVFLSGLARLEVEQGVLLQGVPFAESALSAIETGLGEAGFAINGVSAGDRAGKSVSRAGDVNGDGFEDVIIGADLDSPNGVNSGAGFVVFGRSDGTTVELSDVEGGVGGFVINGVSGMDFLGDAVGSAGDVNGDGLIDLIIGAPGDDPNGDSSGAAYVVFGKTDGTQIELSSVEAGIGGFVINGSSELDIAGARNVDSAGDVNGDGLADVVVGAFGDDPNGESSGAAFIVFGKSDGTAVELSSVEAGIGGFAVNGISELDQSGLAVSRAGDLNGDGLDDVVVGAAGRDANGSASGASFVVFGKTDGTLVELSAVEGGTGGFVINGVSADDGAGISVGGGGDVNGDGIADLIIGADGDGPNGLLSGASFVVFGKTDAGSVELSDVEAGLGGFVINGANLGDYAGISVDVAGDVNGDGLDDLIVGAHFAAPNGTQSGATYVVFGKTDGNVVEASDLEAGIGGFVLNGVSAFDKAGQSVSGAGDINGDGFDDIVIGAYQDDPNGDLSGASFVVYGGDFSGAATMLGSAGNDTLFGTTAPEVIIGGLGNDTLAGKGGADVLRGGAGNDVIAVADLNFSIVDGGTGADALVLDGTGLRLDLRAIPDKRIESIERIDVTGGNTLVLDAAEVLRISEATNTVLVFGGPGDTVELTGSGQQLWTSPGIIVKDNINFTVYTQGNARLEVQEGVTVAGLAAPNTEISEIANNANTAGFAIFGETGATGSSVSAAGDVNGDGFDDVIVGVPGDDTSGTDAGASFVVFGKSDGSSLNLLNFSSSSGGITINGVSAGDAAGVSVSGAGDINGDGFDDLIIGASGDDPGNGDAGTAFVVFGRPGSVTIELSDVEAGIGGFVINGVSGNDQLGGAVGIAGDVNGDGLDDLIVGAQYDDPNGNSSGASFVIFGKTDGTPVQLSNGGAGPDGFVINGVSVNDRSGYAVSAAGDVNGDGLDDLIVGARWDDPNGSASGASFVVFGKVDLAKVELSDIEAGIGGFAINGVSPGDFAGYSVSGAGDVNGDGIDDIFVGARGDNPNEVNAGASFVVFGKSDGSTVELSDIDAGNGGFVINGVSAFDDSGRSVSVAGDVNGDGFDDLIIGADQDDPNGPYSGASFVVFGKSDTVTVALSDVEAGIGGFVLNGVSANDRTGSSVSRAGDVNGDGFDDLIVGASGFKVSGPGDGAGFVVFGGDFSGAATQVGTVGSDSLTGTSAVDRLIGGTGNDTLVGGGGVDVLRAGAGNDVIAVSDVTFQVVDGGNGVDTLRIDGFNVRLDLPAVADPRIESIERIDLAGLSNTLVLDRLEVLRISDATNTLRVTGAATDAVELVNTGGAAWVQAGTVSGGGLTFDVYTSGRATVEVQQGIAVGGDALVTTELSTLITGASADGFVILGGLDDDVSGAAVSNAGDVNGDGLDDLFVSASGADLDGIDRGATYVVFGQIESTPIELLAVESGIGGFVIRGNTDSSQFGSAVSNAGDVNGDGLDDLIMGTTEVGPGSTGFAYVVFGKSDGAPVDISDVSAGTGGFVINGVSQGDSAGASVGAAGDVNGDGLADLIIGALGDDPNGDASGASFVVFGKSDSVAVDLSAVETGVGGFVINGATDGDISGALVSGAGDVNADGFADLIVGVQGDDPNGTESGASFVVFGKENGGAIELSAVESGVGGFVINGVSQFDYSGSSVSNAGDVNGDGFEDLIVGAASDSPNGQYSGASFVVFGKSDGTAVELSTVETGVGGFVINGVSNSDYAGGSVSAAGDFNGDGLADLIVGARGEDNNGSGAGAAFLVFGKSDTTVVELSDVESGKGGFILNGLASLDSTGISVSTAGDVNGDGFDDLLVGAPRNDLNTADSGATFVVFGGDVSGAATQIGTVGNDSLLGTAASDNIIAGTGDDTIVGGGGADVLRGGAGNDVIAISDNGFKVVDGGNGRDVLRLDGTAQTLDLTQIAGPRIDGIEVIDLAGGGNRVVLGRLETLQLSDETSTLRVTGTSSDTVDLSGISGTTWQQTGTLTDNAVNFTIFTNGGVTVEVQEGIALDTIDIIELSDVEAGLGGFVINGLSVNEFAGRVVSNAGDVNGDGFDDLLVGSRYMNIGDTRSFVVFGKPDGTAVELSAVEAGIGGFVINGVSSSDLAGDAISAAGDMNGDGLADLIIGAPLSEPNGIASGASFVVFGKTDGAIVELSAVELGTGGFVINGAILGNMAGASVSDAGDVNGDGIPDVVVGAPGAGPNGVQSGASFVVFGQSDGTAVELSAVRAGSGGFAINGVSQLDSAGAKVSNAGDVNGDGLDDLLIGAPSDAPNGLLSGASFVVFGKSDGTTVELSAIEAGTGGFVINGVSAADGAGEALGSAGDINGDGLDDLVIGVRRDGPNGQESGATFVVFGRTDGTVVELSDIEAGSGGFVINGVSQSDFAGRSVSGAGDINGDGLDDLIIGSDGDDPNGDYSGATFVVFGKSDGSTVELSTVEGGVGGFVLNGVSAGDRAGISVSTAGDVNGDGFDDLIIGAEKDDPNGSNSGASFVVFGGDFSGAVTQIGTVGDDTLTGSAAVDRLVAGTGNDTVIGGGGADILRAGAGNDVIAIGDTTFVVVDGGNGFDTLRLDTPGLTLDLPAIADPRIDGIEQVEFAAAGNTLIVDRLEVQRMSDEGNTLRIVGNVGGTVELSAAEGSWVDQGTIVDGALVLNVFISGRARVEVQQGITIAGDQLITTLLSAIEADANPAGFVINGVSGDDYSGFSVSNAGDVNGDGFDDVIIGAPSDAPNGASSGASFVVFGKADGTAIELSTVEAGLGGFVINGVASGDVAGRAVSGAGDVNGDGLADLIVGARSDDPNGSESGASFVVFGKSDTAVVELSDVEVGVGGFVINGVSEASYAGDAVSNAGDVNGDGLDDLIVGAALENQNGDSSGVSYVVFGKTDGTAVELSAVKGGAGGFSVNGASQMDRAGHSVSGAGDLNGDGLDDLIIGAIGDDPNGQVSGASFVVFGKTDGTAVELSAVETGTGGFAINGVSEFDQAGFSVGGGGDINGDGINDLIIGARQDSPNGISSGATFVVFGKSDGTVVELSAVEAGTNGFVINGVSAGDFAGISVSNAGDVNGDGLDDIIVGASGNGGTGASFVIFGKSDNSAVELSDVELGVGGFVLNGVSNSDYAGRAVSGGGDINGDGFDDLIIGAYLDGPNDDDSGASFVVFGGDFSGAVTQIGTTGNDGLVGSTADDVIITGTGNDTILAFGGGADVLRTGAGDDEISIFDLGFKLIDGGNGFDIVRLDGANLRLDLPALADTTLTSIEQINLFGGHTVVLDRAEVLRLSEATNTLRLEGIASDTVELIGGPRDVWVTAGTVIDDLVTYTVLTNGRARLEIREGITITGNAFATTEASAIASNTNPAGFVINGVSENDFSGSSVSLAGDINGDGFDDVIVSATTDDPNGTSSGASFVVFGKAGGTAVELSDVEAGVGGFVINGVSQYDASGASVSGGGDINGDGIADLIIGANNDDPNGDASGATFVVFGKSDGSAVELSAVEAGIGGFVVNGVSENDGSGISLSNAGDVNGDGFADLIIGAPGDDPNGDSSGASFVVFGKSDTTAVELSEVETGIGGFVINGGSQTDRIGSAVSNAGDVNGDGLADLIVSSAGVDPNGDYSGASYIVFGKSDGTAVELSSVETGAGGFAINGAASFDFSGTSVSNAGDVNGDGLDDLIIGANGDDPNEDGSGASFVVFGKTDTATVELSDVEAGVGGFAINGVSADDASGGDVSTAGDVNGDGLADLIVGATGVDTNGEFSGAAYVVFGKSDGAAVELSDVDDGLGGFALNGIEAFDILGRAVSAGGDVDGDGFDDIIIGVSSGDAPAGDYAGTSYVVFGGDVTGAVTEVGTAGNDTLTGTSVAEVLFGGAGDDQIIGAGGDDRVSGAQGNDTFVASTVAGTLTIIDFEAGEGPGDVLDLSAFNFANVAAVLVASSPAGQAGEDTLITLAPGSTVLLRGVETSDLNADDFLI